MSIDKDKEKSKINERYKGDKDLICIPAIPKIKFRDDTATKRVAVYARVSTDDIRQKTSIALQRNNYADLVREHKGWELVGIYEDEGISGTSLEHRESFKKMIEDCNAGKIDIIVTKSISRFSRNLVDCVDTVRNLANLPNRVGVYFETEGLFTLDSTTEMMLAILSTVAQEESHTKSEIMNASIEQRFKRGIFLTPVLLGFDKDEEGNLVVNKDEAETVMVCFYMYLNEYSPSEIAELMNVYQRKTKPGNTKWSHHTVYALLKNERYCGDVISRKTYTPDFLTHKSRKNRQDRNQYHKLDHHEAIVPRTVFEAVNKKIVCYKCAKAGKVVPILRIVNKGSLSGYVPVDRLWHGFFLDDYDNAYKSIEEKNTPAEQKIINKFPGFQVVRQQFFSLLEKPTLYFTDEKLSFSTNCMKRFRNVEYVEILFNPVEKKLAIRPCPSSNPNAIKWGRNIKGRWHTSAKSCRGFSGPLFERMEWEGGQRYRISGQYINNGNQQLLVFNLDNNEKMVKKGRSRYNIIFAERIKNRFGSSFNDYVNEQDKWKETHDLYASAAEVSSMNPLSDKEIIEYKNIALDIIDKWKGSAEIG